MKKHRSSAGFTLAELLVTIGIIAILAAILLPTLNAAFKKADKAKAQQEMASIVAAIKAYSAEYGKMPTPWNGEGDRTYNDQTGPVARQNEVMDILRSIDDPTTNPGNRYNPRKIVFLDVPRASLVGTDRTPYTYTEDEGYFLDPWGNPYVICMDTDYDSEIGVSDMGSPAQAHLDAISPASGAVFPGVTVGVMSYGADSGDTNEFLISW